MLSSRQMEYQVSSKEFDVLIVGSGPVGLWLACELALELVVDIKRGHLVETALREAGSDAVPAAA